MLLCSNCAWYRMALGRQSFLEEKSIQRSGFANTKATALGNRVRMWGTTCSSNQSSLMLPPCLRACLIGPPMQSFPSLLRPGMATPRRHTHPKFACLFSSDLRRLFHLHWLHSSWCAWKPTSEHCDFQEDQEGCQTPACCVSLQGVNGSTFSP